MDAMAGLQSSQPEEEGMPESSMMAEKDWRFLTMTMSKSSAREKAKWEHRTFLTSVLMQSVCLDRARNKQDLTRKHSRIGD